MLLAAMRSTPITYMLLIIATFANLTGYSDSTMELKDNTVIVVLGASGDLAKKKTVGLALRECCMLPFTDCI